MCDFISAVKTKDKKGNEKWYYLTYDMIHNTPGGDIILKRFPGEGEPIGHAAIRAYFNLREGRGEDWEQIDFSTPENFPPVIVDAIKRGEFAGLGWSDALLSPEAIEQRKADAEYKKADAEYKKARAEYRKAYVELEKAYAEYNKADAEQRKAYAEYKKADAEIGWKLFANPENRNPLWK